MLHVLLAAAVLLSVVGANGRPGVFPDTAVYYSQGRYIAGALGLAAPGDASAASRDPTAIGLGHEPAEAVAGARSPLYGALLYAVSRLGSTWLLAALQGALCTSLLWLLVRAAVGRRAPLLFHGLNLALALGSSLAFYAGFLMPDIFAGLMVAGAGLLVVYRGRLSPLEQASLAALVAVSAALHAANLMLMAGLALAVAAGCALLRPRLRLSGRAVTMAMLVLTAVLLHVAQRAGMNASLGLEQGQPPFLAARVLADGPGRLELAAVCRSDDEPYALCRWGRLPLDNSDDILWEVKPAKGVYGVATAAQRRRILDEQSRFVAASIVRAPLAEAAAALGNFGRQLRLYQVEEPLRNPNDFLTNSKVSDTAIPSLIPDIAPCARGPGPCEARAPYGFMIWAHGVVLLLSTAFIGWRLCKPDAQARLRRGGPEAEDLRRLLAFTALTGLAILLNAALCGALSEPAPRYEARLVWLWPACAFLLGKLLGWPPEADRSRV